jgi:RNA polymerase sigma factor (sigma-70 family)
MTNFQIQNNDGTLSSVSHKEFYETLNGGDGYLYYKRGGKHIALLPTAKNAETLRVCRQAEDAEYEVADLNTRCRDAKGQPCRYQHDESGRIIRNERGHAIRARCADCPRDGWIAGKRENCCLSNYCKTHNCAYCPYHREFNAPLSLEWQPENIRGDDESDTFGSYLSDPDADIQAALENDELNSALQEAVYQLPQTERDIIKSIYWDNLSRRAYATEHGISKDAANRLHDRALESLKNILKNFC